MTSSEFFKNTLKMLTDKAKENDYTGDELVMIPELMNSGKSYVMQWLKDDEFKTTFKGNTTAYYLGLCANSVGGGMMYANAWADSSLKFDALKYDDLYDGSVWENIFSLAELKSDAEKNNFRKFVMIIFEEWVKNVYPYLSLNNAGDYLIESFNAFFQLGAAIKLCTLGY